MFSEAETIRLNSRLNYIVGWQHVFGWMSMNKQQLDIIKHNQFIAAGEFQFCYALISINQ